MDAASSLLDWLSVCVYVCMCVCVHVCMCVCVCMDVWVHGWIGVLGVGVSLCVWVHAWMYVCMSHTPIRGLGELFAVFGVQT